MKLLDIFITTGAFLGVAYLLGSCIVVLMWLLSI